MPFHQPLYTPQFITFENFKNFYFNNWPNKNHVHVLAATLVSLKHHVP